MLPAEPCLTDDDLRRWRACARRYWLHRQRAAGAAAVPLPRLAAPAASVAAVARAEADALPGPAPDEALRACFPGARAIATPHTPADWAAAVQATRDALGDPRLQAEGAALFGACFRLEPTPAASRESLLPAGLLGDDHGVQVRIDVVVRGAQGLRLFKLRWATVGGEADVDAVALWAHVVARGGWRVQGVGLLLVDTDFLYPGHGCWAGLLREVDLAPVLGSRPVGDWLLDMRACARGAPPPVALEAPCTLDGGCEFLACCLADDPGARVADARASLEVVGRELAADLRHEGHADLHSVPLARLTNARHRRAALAVQRDAPVLEPTLGGWLRAQPYPRHYLRIDTIGFAVPLWAGTRPYQVLPFQWTVDVEPAAGLCQRHRFLAGHEAEEFPNANSITNVIANVGAGDPRRAFAERLLQTLGDAGPVFAYNAGFERNRLRELARHFEDLAGALDALQPRIIDLFQLARANYYHPAMAGSWSFKSICRTLGPGWAVDRADWAGAASAPAAFARSLQRRLPAATVRALRLALIRQGRHEAAALRRMVAVFEGD